MSVTNDQSQTGGCTAPAYLSSGDSPGPKTSFFHDRRKVARIAVIIIAIALLALFALHLNGWSADFTDRDVRLIVTDSMDGEPTDYEISTIPKGSLVMVRLIGDDDKSKLEKGDVIQFWYHGILNHHRLVSNDPASERIVTKGDNSLASETVLYKDIRGKVVGQDPVAGKLVSFVKEHWLIVIVMLIGITVAWEIAKAAVRAKRKEDEERMRETEGRP